MMVDDDDVALRRPAVHFGDEALVPRTALLSQASVRARVQFVPQGARLWQRRQLRPVAARGGLLPRGNRAILLDFVQAAEHRLTCEVVELFAAQIVVSSLHVADAQLPIALGKKRLLKKWDIFVKQVLLQILGARGYEQPLAGANYRHNESQFFSCARCC